MPKHEPMTPKAISNRIKSKGLQKLRWYCQMCQKQCRDQNGFKCHLLSESHQRQLLLFGENPNSYLGEFSGEFQKGFLDILRRQYGTKRVRANQIYQEYIKDKHHIHMNATSWMTLTGFVNYLGRVGICKIDNTEKGWFVQYIDREDEERKTKHAKKQKMDKDDDERMQEFVQKQADKAMEKLTEEEQQAKFTELQKPEDEKIAFEFQATKPSAEEQKPTLAAAAPEFKTSSDKKPILGKKERSKKSALDEIREMEERRKEMRNRKDHWLHEGILVKILTKRAGERYYKKKGVIKELIDEYTAVVEVGIDDSMDELKMDQAHLETVIPALGKPVLVVNGAYRGLRAILMSIDTKNFCVSVKIDKGPIKGRVLDRVDYEDVCKLNM